MRHRVHDRFSFTRYQLWACWVIQKHGHSRIIRPHYTVQNPTLQSLNDWFYVGSAKIYERVFNLNKVFYLLIFHKLKKLTFVNFNKKLNLKTY